MKETYPAVFKNYCLGYDTVKNAYSIGMIPQFSNKEKFKYEVSE